MNYYSLVAPASIKPYFILKIKDCKRLKFSFLISLIILSLLYQIFCRINWINNLNYLILRLRLKSNNLFFRKCKKITVKKAANLAVYELIRISVKNLNCWVDFKINWKILNLNIKSNIKQTTKDLQQNALKWNVGWNQHL